MAKVKLFVLLQFSIFIMIQSLIWLLNDVLGEYMWLIQCSSCISTLSIQHYAVQKHKPYILTFDESLQEVS